MILSKKYLFQNINVKLNSKTWMTLKSSIVIFQALKPLQPQWPRQPQQPQWPQWPQQPQWPQWLWQPHFIKNLTGLDVSINPGTKITYPGSSMWDGSSKIYYFIDFWHPCSWRLWRACNIKKIKTDKLAINESISLTHRTQNISKHQNLYPHQSRITFPSLLWDTLYYFESYMFIR